MKKNVKILMTLLAALLVGLLLVTACTNPTNGDPGADGKDGTAGKEGAPGVGEEGKQGEQGEAGGTGPEGKPGANVETVTTAVATGALLTSYFNGGVDKVFLTDTVGGSTNLQPGTYNVPANKTLVISGAVTLSANTHIDAVKGTLDLSNGTLGAGAGNIKILLNAKDRDAAGVGSGSSKITGYDPPTYMASITAVIPGTTEEIAVPSISAGGTGDPTWAQMVTYIGAHPVYVIDDLVIKNDTLVLTGSTDVTVYGDVKAEGALTLGALTGLTLDGSLVATNPLTVKGLNNFTGTIDTDSYKVTVDPDGSLINVTLAALNGDGALVLPPAITTVNITAGDGNIEYTAGSLALAASTFGNTGKTVFADSLALAGASSFNGTAIIGSGKTITGNFAITLKQPAAALAAGTAETYTPVLTTDGANDVAITTAANTTLGFSLTGVTQSATAAGAHTVTIAGSGTPELVSSYTVGSASGSVGTLKITGGALSVGATGELVLASAASGSGAAINGTGTVVAGTTTIASVDAGGWEAIGTGNITITADTIGGATAAFTAKNASSAITVAEELTVAGKVDLAALGTLTLNLDAALKGTGVVATNDIEIVGGSANGWKAAGSAGSIGIKAGTVTASANTAILTAGVGASITVPISGTLTLATDTAIELGGSGDGSIVLTGDSVGSNGAILWLAAITTSTVTTANTTGSGSNTTIPGVTPNNVGATADGDEKLKAITASNANGTLKAGSADVTLSAGLGLT
jgi:hypothetical protein